MVEREQGAERSGADERVDTVSPLAGFEPASDDQVGSEPGLAAENARHDRIMASATRVMAKHRNVFAELAK